MKTIVTLTLVFIIFSCNNSPVKENKDKNDIINNCGGEFNELQKAFIDCNGEYNSYFKNYELSGACLLYSNVSYESQDNHICKDTINNFSCLELSNIKTISDFEALQGCLDFTKKTKTEVCFETQLNYCNQIYYECGISKLYGICNESETYINHSEDGTTEEIKFNETSFQNYCLEMIDGSDKISSLNDMFYYGCSIANNLDCSNIQEIDFRNDDWKTLCIE
jgi:hypothetical protein